MAPQNTLSDRKTYKRINPSKIMHSDSSDLATAAHGFALKQERTLTGCEQALDVSSPYELHKDELKDLLQGHRDTIKVLTLMGQLKRISGDQALTKPVQKLERVSERYNRILAKVCSRGVTKQPSGHPT